MIASLLAAEAAAGPDPLTPERRQAVFRHLHTLKGEACILGLGGLVSAAEAVEALLAGPAAAPAIRAALAGLHSETLPAPAGLSAAVIEALAAALGKAVKVEIEGDAARVPPALGASVRGALVHLVRNALVHGIERKGRIRLRFLLSPAGAFELSCADDGRGLDPDALVARAVALHLVAADAAPALSADARLSLAFLAGVSTAAEPSTLAGRGVGLDAVRAFAEASGGTASIDSAPGRGTRVTLRFPGAA